MDVSNNPLDSTEFLERLRADWAKQCNLMLPEGVRIDHRSLEAQGIERIPTIHEGHASREITKRGGHSILNAINRRIATANRYLTAIRKQMGDPTGLLGAGSGNHCVRSPAHSVAWPATGRSAHAPPQEHVRQELGIQA